MTGWGRGTGPYPAAPAGGPTDPASATAGATHSAAPASPAGASGDGSSASEPEGGSPSEATPTARPARRRDQYIDGLRALALVRVMAYHTFGWIWLPVAFPSMGVMFALGGSLVAASLSASTTQSQVLRRRVRRLLPPLWLYGIVLVPVMVWQGWTVTTTAGTPLTWRTAVFWLLPLDDPPGSAWAYDFVLPLWYIRTYLWLLLLSPFLLWLFRRYPLPMLALPALLHLAISQNLIETSTPTGDTVLHLATFGACWMLGFAHHDGRIARLPRWRTIGVAALLMAAGLAFALTHQTLDSRWDIDDIYPADALYSAGAVLLLLRLYPRRTFLERMPRLSKLVSAINSRAMTIYLWGNVSIWGATWVIESNPVTARWENPGVSGQLLQFGVSWLVVLVIVLAVGWAEDVAAGRHPRINPWPRTPRVPAQRGISPAAGRPSTSAAAGRPSTSAAAGRPSTSPAARSGLRARVPNLALGMIAAMICVVLGVGIVASSSATAGAPIPSGGLPVAGPVSAGAGSPAPTRYPLHPGIRATVFWIGAVGQADAGDNGQSLSSAWESQWAQHYGGCDGLGSPGSSCRSDVERRVGPDWFPTSVRPRQNPYYVGLPYNDLVSTKSTDRWRIPWSADPGFAPHLNDRSVSFIKNRWVAVSGPRGTCYAQVEDSGPGPLDTGYVLGTARPADTYGINLSPAVYRCVGLNAAAGSGNVDWRFVDAPLPGPWARIITTQQVS